jgi:hypothetical protein
MLRHIDTLRHFDIIVTEYIGTDYRPSVYDEFSQAFARFTALGFVVYWGKAEKFIESVLQVERTYFVTVVQWIRSGARAHARA